MPQLNRETSQSYRSVAFPTPSMHACMHPSKSPLLSFASLKRERPKRGGKYSRKEREEERGKRKERRKRQEQPASPPTHHDLAAMFPHHIFQPLPDLLAAIQARGEHGLDLATSGPNLDFTLHHQHGDFILHWRCRCRCDSIFRRRARDGRDGQERELQLLLGVQVEDRLGPGILGVHGHNGDGDDAAARGGEDARHGHAGVDERQARGVETRGEQGPVGAEHVQGNRDGRARVQVREAMGLERRRDGGLQLLRALVVADAAAAVAGREGRDVEFGLDESIIVVALAASKNFPPTLPAVSISGVFL